MPEALSYPTYLHHLRAESARFRQVLSDCDPAARVPACPDWDAADLVWHLSEVQWFWATTIRVRPGTVDDAGIERPERPAPYPGLLETFDEFSQALVTELEQADPVEDAWHWHAGTQTVGASYSRQAHEALIHRIDAEQTAGVPTPVDVELAADGVREALDWMYGGEPPPWASFTPTGDHVAVELADADVTRWVSPGELTGTDPDSGRVLRGPHLLLVVEPDTPAAASVRGTAADLDAWLWHRSGDDVVSTHGDQAALAAFRAAVAPAID